MAAPLPVHRTILAVDVAGFGHERRTTPDQLAARAGLYRAMSRALAVAGVVLADCHHEDRGDGMLVLIAADCPKNPLVELLPAALVKELCGHNRACGRDERVQLRLSLHAGEVVHDEHGVVGSSITHAFRLLESAPLKAALAGSTGVLAMIVSDWFHDNVVRHCPGAEPDSYRRVRVTVKETTANAWVRLPDSPVPWPGVEAGVQGPVPRQLPAAPAGFAGRAAELLMLDALLPVADELVVSVVTGTAGVGKTALALRWAHRIADRFPDGQLYADLRGFGPGAAPAAPEAVLRDFLAGLGVAASLIPVGVEVTTALYRSTLAGRRVLIVLDNASDSAQVRPLLPGSSGCLVVVTSRDQLTGLVTHEGARPLILDLLSNDDARRLLAHRIGAPRVAAEPEAVARIVDASARLPLALGIAAARAVARPDFPLSILAAELRAGRLLDAFDAGDPDTAARSVFSWSYRGLGADAAALFRMTGLHPGPDLTLPAAACLLAVPSDRARRALAELANANLAEEHRPGRYVGHDLLRAYAADLAAEHDPAPARAAAVRRLLDHYLCSAHAAAGRLYFRLDQISPTAEGTTGETFTGYAAAWSWFEAEYPVLLAAVRHAAQLGCHTHAWQLAWVLTEYMDREGFWHDAIAAQETALAAARDAGDAAGIVHAHRGLGHAYLRLRQHAVAAEHLTEALDLLSVSPDRTGEVHTLIDIAWMHSQQGDPAQAHRYAKRALALARAAGDDLGQARALTAIGGLAIRLGKYRAGLQHSRASLLGYEALKDARGIAYATHTIGLALHHLGKQQEAVSHFERAIVVKSSLHDHYRMAVALDDLGATHHALGDADSARIAWQRAVDILVRLGLDHPEHHIRPDTADLRRKIAALD